MLLVASLLAAVSAHAQTSWKGTTSTAWNIAANWTAGVPTASVDAVIGDANFTGANQPQTGVGSVCKSLTIGNGTKASTLSVGPLTVAGHVTIGTNGTITHNTGTTIPVTGNWTNSGSYLGTSKNSTVAFAGTTQATFGTTTFKNLDVNAGSILTLNAAISVASALTVNGTLDPNESPTFAVSGAEDLTVNAGGKILVKGTTFVSNYALSGTITLNAASTVEYAAASASQTINNTLTYGTLRISGGLTKSLAGNLPALNSTAATAGHIDVSSGTLDLASFTAARGTTTAGGTFSIASAGTLKIGGANTFPANYTTRSFGSASTVEYNGTNQTVSAQSYGNLTLSSSGAATKTMPVTAMTLAGNLTSRTNAGGASVSFTAGAAITVNGSADLGNGTTFNGGSYSHSVGANWTNNGTFTGAASTVTMNGVNGVLTGTGATTFNNLTLARSGISMTPNTSVTVAGDISTSGVGTFTHTTGGSGTITLSGAGNTINGLGMTFNNFVVSGSIITATSFAVYGNFGVSGIFSASGGVVTLAGSGKTIYESGTNEFYAISVPGSITTTSSFSLKGDWSVSGSFTATAGTITAAGTTLFSGTASAFNATLNGTLRMAQGSLVRLGGVTTFISGTFDSSSLTPNTVVYSGTSAQFVLGNYNNLQMAAGGDRIAVGDITCTGNFIIDPGAVFNGGAGGFTNYVSGNWQNQGTYNAGNSTVEFTGVADASISGSSTFNRLRVNQTDSSVKILLAADQTVATLDMAVGWLDTGTNTVNVTTTRTGNGVILGTITRTHAFTTNTAYAFESPNNTVTFAALTSVSSVTVKTEIDPVEGFPYGGSINRQYTINLDASGAYAATLRLHYEDAELNGNTESALSLWRHTSAWSVSGKTSNDTTSNWVEESALTDVTGRWTLSADENVVRWNGSVSTAWDNSTNWTVLQGGPTLPPSTNEIVQLGDVVFGNQPAITSPAAVKAIQFGSAQAVTLSLAAGGSLTTGGNVEGDWDNNVTHTIAVGAQTFHVGGDLSLSDGDNGQAINLTASSGMVTVSGLLRESGGANITFTGNGALNIGGDFDYSSGIFSAGTSTVTYDGAAAQIVAGVTYHHLSFNKPFGTAALGSPATVNGNLVLSSGSLTLDAALTVMGNVTLAAGTMLNGGAATFTVSGNWTSGGTFIPGAGTVVLSGGNAQNISVTTFNHFTVNKSSGMATIRRHPCAQRRPHARLRHARPGRERRQSQFFRWHAHTRGEYGAQGRRDFPRELRHAQSVGEQHGHLQQRGRAAGLRRDVWAFDSHQRWQQRQDAR